MSHDSLRTPAVIAASAAALAGLVGFALYQRTKSSTTKNNSPATASSSKDASSEVVSPNWTALQVQTWLRVVVKASPAAVKAFADNDIDGDILLSINDQHLQALGIVSLGDRIRISRGIENAVAATITTTTLSKKKPTPPAAPAVAEDEYDEESEEEESSTPISAAIAGAPTKQSSVETARAMLVAIEKVYTTFSGEAFQNASGEEQKRLVYACKLLFEDNVVSKLQLLTPEDLEKLAPSIEGTAEFLSRVFSKINAASGDDESSAAAEISQQVSSSTEPAASEGQLPEELSATLLQRTIPIIRTFYQTLDSPDLLKAPAAERARICNSVIEEINKIRKLADKLAAKHSEALLGVCDRVASVAAERAAGRTDPSAAAASSESSPRTATGSTASSGFLLQRLRALYGVLSAPTFIQTLTQKTPEEVQRIATKMNSEVASITKDANALEDADQRKVIMEVVQQLSGILSQVTALGESMDGPGGAEAAKQVDAATNPSSPVEISQALKSILQVIQTPKFQEDPSDDLPALVNLTESCMRAIGKVEDEAVRTSLATLAGKIKDMLGHAARIAFAGQKQREAAAGIAREEDGRNQQNQRVATGRPSQQFQVVKETLEQVFTIVSGDDFNNASETEKLQIIELLKEQMMKALNLIRSVVQDPTEQQSLLGLWKSIVELLEKVTLSVTTSVAADQDDYNTNNSAADGSVLEHFPTNAISIEEALQEVRSLYSIVQSEEFISADPTNQVIISQGLYRDCTTLMARIQAAPGNTEEGLMLHEKVKPLVRQLRDVLEGHLQNASKMSELNDSAEVDDEEENSDPRAGMFQCLVQATRILRERKNQIGMSELREIVGTLENVEEIGIQTEEEQAIRDDCAAAVQEVLEALEAGGNLLSNPEEEGEENQEDYEEEEEGEEEEEEETADPTTASEGEQRIIDEMIKTLSIVSDELRGAGPTFTSGNQLLPFMNAAEDVISQVEENGINWQSNPMAVKLVSSLFTAIQNYQKQLSEQDRPTSQIEVILKKAHSSLEKAILGGQLRSVQDLEPFLEIAATIQESEDGLTLDDRKALMNFQKLLLHANSTMKASEEKKLQNANNAAAALAEANGGGSSSSSRQPSQGTTSAVDAARKAVSARNSVSPRSNNRSAPTQDEDASSTHDSPSKNSKGGITEGQYDDATAATTPTAASSPSHQQGRMSSSSRSSSDSSSDATPVSRHNINAKSPTASKDRAASNNMVVGSAPTTPTTTSPIIAKSDNHSNASSSPRPNQTTTNNNQSSPVVDTNAASTTSTTNTEPSRLFPDPNDQTVLELQDTLAFSAQGSSPKPRSPSKATTTTTTAAASTTTPPHISRLPLNTTIAKEKEEDFDQGHVTPRTGTNNTTHTTRKLLPPLVTMMRAHQAVRDTVISDDQFPHWTSRADEFVYGGLKSETDLLPRIIERLNHESGATFLSDTTLFEVLCIARLLDRLGSSHRVHVTEIAKIVRHTKKMFILALHQGANNNCTALDAEGEMGGLTSPRSLSTPPGTPRGTQNQYYSIPSQSHVASVMAQLLQPNSPVCIDLKEVTKGPQEGVRDLPLSVTGMRSENEARGQDIFQYTIFSQEEDSYHVDNKFMFPLLQSEADDSLRSICDAIRPPVTDNLSYDYRAAHHGRPMQVVNLAIIIGVSTKLRDARSTMAAELSMICDVLDTEYAFDSAVVTDDNLTKESLEGVIRQAVQMNTDKHPIGRLLFFIRTDAPSIQHQRNFAITFSDGTNISHRELCGIVPQMEGAGELVNPVHKTLLIHDSDNSLQVLAQNYDPIAKTLPYRYRCSAHVAVSVTAAAKSVANSSRCWLYDGLFTPIIGEMLTVGASHVHQLYLLEVARNLPSSSVVPFHEGPFRPSKHGTIAPSLMRREMHELGDGGSQRRHSLSGTVAIEADPFCFRLCPEDIVNYAILALTKQMEADRVSTAKADLSDPLMSPRTPRATKYARDVDREKALTQGVLMSPNVKKHRDMQFMMENESEFIHSMGNCRRRIQPPKVGRSVLHDNILSTGFFTNTTTENVITTDATLTRSADF